MAQLIRLHQALLRRNRFNSLVHRLEQTVTSINIIHTANPPLLTALLHQGTPLTYPRPGSHYCEQSRRVGFSPGTVLRTRATPGDAVLIGFMELDCKPEPGSAHSLAKDIDLSLPA